MKKTKIIVSFLLFLCLSNNLFAQIKNTYYIMQYLRHPKKDLVAVCAHRGYWMENGVPENSLYAIQRAVNVGIETIELDIKMSSDGIPVLSHDVTLGRCTNIPQVFPNKGNNPSVSWFPSGDLQKLRLKDKNGNLTNEHLPTFEQAMNYINAQRLSVVIVLDIKDQAATRACWEIVKRKENYWHAPAYDWVIFKLNATVYGENPKSLENDLHLSSTHGVGQGHWISYDYNFKYIPVFTTNMYEKLNCLKTYNNYKGKPYFVAVEVDLKQNNGIHSDIVNQANRDGKTLVCFNALPDAGGDRFWKVDYSGTYRLKDIYYRSSNGRARDTEDNRGSWQWLVSWNCRMITTDQPYTLIIDYLKGKGKRNEHWYYDKWPTRMATESDSTSYDSLNTTTNDQFNEVETITSTSLPVFTDSLITFPNPTDGKMNVTILQKTTGYTLFELIDQSGNSVYKQNIYIDNGLQDITSLDLKSAGVKPGVYILQATLPDTGKRRMKRVIVR